MDNKKTNETTTEDVVTLQRETINALLEIAPEVLEQIHGGLAGGCDCCKWEAAVQ